MITGGARSGKSRYASEQALAISGRPLHVATARIWDEEIVPALTKAIKG